MDKEILEDDAISIDRIDIVGDSDIIGIAESEDTGGVPTDDDRKQISSIESLKTGNIISQVFNLIAQFKEKDYWELNTTEINSLNKTCPKILPDAIIKHAGIIGCVLSLIGIILKRIKLDRQDKEDEDLPQLITDESEQISEGESLVGGRSG